MSAQPQRQLTGLEQQVRSGSARAVARAITLIESGGSEGEALIDLLYPHFGPARIIGVTGPPGAGKSTLVDGLLTDLRSRGERVGVLAVDPSSPFSGGALLGDRLRMARHAADSGVFIRSMATRGHRGGLTLVTTEAAGILQAAGFTTVIIETVGVGQSEVEIMSAADVVLVVLVPGAGDDIQALKAGIMEIGDIYVVNKSDLPGAAELAALLRFALRGEENPTLDDCEHPDSGHADNGDPDTLPKPVHAPQVHLASALNGSGLAELMVTLEQTEARLQASGELDRRRRRRSATELERIAQAAVRGWLVDRGIVPVDPDQLLREFERDNRGPHRFIRERLEEAIRNANRLNGGASK